jgi:cell division control protein 45
MLCSESDDSDSESEDEQSNNQNDDEGEHEFDDGPVHSRRINDDASEPFEESENEDEESVEQSTKRRKVDSTTRDAPRSPGEADDDNLAKDKLDRDQPGNPLDTTAATADLTMTQDSDDEAEPTTTTAAPITFRELHRQRRNRIRLHYSSGAYHASPSSWMAYTLCSQLRFGNVSDLLWLACVGVTDAYLHGRLDVSGYSALCVDLKRHVGRLFPNEMVDRVGRAVYAEELEMSFNQADAAAGMTQIGLSENGRILSQSEYKFMLLRHTSLWDSLLHSNFVASKLQVWKSEGRQKLMELLAKMGFPLEDCRQPWAFVGVGLRRNLKERIDECAEVRGLSFSIAFGTTQRQQLTCLCDIQQDYGLGNVTYTGFVRVTGYKSLLSASDMVYAVTALLECSAAAIDGASTKKDDSDDLISDEEREERDIVQAFNVAYDALNTNAFMDGGVEGSDLSNLVNGGNMTGTTGLGAGIRLAMTLQKTIMSTARNLVDRNSIIRLNHFRYAYLNCSGKASAAASSSVVTPDAKDTDSKHYHVFAKPLVLSRLAQFLMDMHRENGKWTGTKARPLVLLAEKPRSNTYMVVGYEYPEEAGNVVRNKFGQNFELAAKSMRGTFWFDSFDSNVVEVAGKDVQRFIEQLHYMMDSV